jgi:hypothetical protein
MEKYRPTLTIANQYLAELGEATVAAVIGNVGSLLVLQVGIQYAEILGAQFGGDLLPRDLLALPPLPRLRPIADRRYAEPPVLMATIPPPRPADPNRAAVMRRTSRHRYAKPATSVEEELPAAFAQRQSPFRLYALSFLQRMEASIGVTDVRFSDASRSVGGFKT